ncbi:MAG: hypothetical protein WCF81_09845 [Roseiarcus sp.]
MFPKISIRFSGTLPLRKGIAHAPSAEHALDEATRLALLTAIARSRAWIEMVIKTGRLGRATRSVPGAARLSISAHHRSDRRGQRAWQSNRHPASPASAESLGGIRNSSSGSPEPKNLHLPAFDMPSGRD